MAGPYAAKVQGTGLIAAHLHDFLTNLYPTFGGGRNWLRTPGFIERFFASPLPEVINRSYGTAFKPGQQSQGSSTGASTGGVLPESWKNRGSGHRLGGD
jgi:Derlin-2/3